MEGENLGFLLWLVFNIFLPWALLIHVISKPDKDKKELDEKIYELRKELDGANKRIEHLQKQRDGAYKLIENLEEHLAVYDKLRRKRDKLIVSTPFSRQV